MALNCSHRRPASSSWCILLGGAAHALTWSDDPTADAYVRGLAAGAAVGAVVFEGRESGSVGARTALLHLESGILSANCIVVLEA